MLELSYSTPIHRLVAHVDMDAFYTSIEQNDQPMLRGRPVIVGGAKGRGVVAAASYEARQYGVKSAMPGAVARRLCPEGFFLPSRMSRYKEVSELIFSIFSRHSPAVEGVSLDEAYLDLSHLGLKDAPAIERFGRMLKKQIATETGLTASVGLAHNKLLAKLASDYDKPDGLVYLPDASIDRVLAPLPIRRLPGVGPRTAQKLQGAGLLTIGQLQNANSEVLFALVGDGHSELKDRALGIDHRPVKATRMRQSISQETTFEKNISRPDEVIKNIATQATQVAERLTEKQLWAKTVHIKLRSGGFSTLTRSVSLPDLTQEAGLIEKKATELFQQWVQWHPSFAIRLIGVGVSVTDVYDS